MNAGFRMIGVPTGIRTPVAAVKGRCPRPLDDRDMCLGGARRNRTDGLLHAMQALYQLSYSPRRCLRMTIILKGLSSVNINIAQF